MRFSVRTFPVFCPVCQEPVMIVLDTRAHFPARQIWDCPHCGRSQTARFDAKIAGVIPRAYIHGVETSLFVEGDAAVS
jgi:hypothetical protein